MKKLIACVLIVALLGASVNSFAAQSAGRGGFMGFIAGCCFGIRAGAAYNDGKELHWREWVLLIPYIGIVFAIWNGVDGAKGVTSKELAAKYGAMYY